MRRRRLPRLGTNVVCRLDLWTVHALVVTWAPGGNLPPLLAAACLLRARGHRVDVLGSAATRPEAERASLPTRTYRRSPEPNAEIAFEHQAAAMLATAASRDVALDVRDALVETNPGLVVVDCMLPAALAAGEATATPTASLVHFRYGLARRVMATAGGSWTTDLARLNETRRELGLPTVRDGLAAWEAPDLVLVTAPSWLDEVEFPSHVVHAGPLGVRTGQPGRQGDRVLLSFSTTVMDGQDALINRVLAATGEYDAILTTAGADHDALMPECAAVVTHGGLGTTLRALAHGVPLLLLPLGRDQPANAARVAELGAGIVLAPDSQPAEIRAGLQRLLADEHYATAAAAIAARIAADEPDRRAVGALESLASRAASS